MNSFKIGDLVRDRLNKGNRSYGLGIVVSIESPLITGEKWDRTALQAKKYAVYFNRFARTITFHGDYLERV